MFAVAIVCIGAPLFELAMYPPYRFALALPQTWHGGLEASVVTALLMLAQIIRRPVVCLIFVCIIGELYLRHHGVDAPVALDLIYLEIIVAIGACARRLSGVHTQDSAGDYLKCFALGVAAWSVAAWGLSAIGPGSVRALRVLTIALALIAFTTRPRLLSSFVMHRVARWPLNARFIAALMMGWMLVLFAKTGVAVGFDSLWYGLRGEFVLVGEGSAFKSTGLVSAVYYFPKLYELLLIPVSGLGIPSAVSGMSIMIFGVFSIACYDIARRLGVHSIAMRIAMTLACVTLPLISNPATDPKPELLAGLFVLMTSIYAARFVHEQTIEAALWMVACAILATQAKLVTIPYVAIIVLASAALRLRSRHQAPRVSLTTNRESIVVLVLASIACILITARTLLLAGMPTIGPDALFHLWQLAGFNLRFPVGTLAWTSNQHFDDIPSIALQMLFQPQLLEHIVTHWTGNIWLWALCVTPLFVRVHDGEEIRGRKVLVQLCAILGFVGLILEFGIAYGVRGGDGNYFISAVAPATMLSLALLYRRLATYRARQAFIACLCAFTIFQGAFSFISANWYSGTREFDTKFSRNIHAYRKTTRELLMTNGLYEIDRYLRHLHRPSRVIGCMRDDIDMRLSARAESIQQIAYSRPDFLESEKAFATFLRDDNIDFLIVPRSGNTDAYCFASASPELTAAIAAIAASSDVRTISDTGYVMYDLSRWRNSERR